MESWWGSELEGTCPMATFGGGFKGLVLGVMSWVGLEVGFEGDGSAYPGWG